MPEEILKELREKYKPGTLVLLEKMDDAMAPPIKTRGTVTSVDDIGTIHVNWETGSSLGVVYGEDRVSVISEGR